MSIFNRIKEYAIFIAYDENYRKLSEKSKEFLLAHELGHIVNQNPCTHELSDEGPADKYALDHVEKPSRSEIKKWPNGFLTMEDATMKTLTKNLLTAS